MWTWQLLLLARSRGKLQLSQDFLLLRCHCIQSKWSMMWLFKTVACIFLKCRLDDWAEIGEGEVRYLKSGSVVILHVRCSNSVVLQYGKDTYNPMYNQSDRGYSKFFSILKYLVCEQRNSIWVVTIAWDSPIVQWVWYFLMNKTYHAFKQVVMKYTGKHPLPYA